MLQWKTRLTLLIGTLALLAAALGYGGDLDPTHFGW